MYASIVAAPEEGIVLDFLDELLFTAIFIRRFMNLGETAVQIRSIYLIMRYFITKACQNVIHLRIVCQDKYTKAQLNGL